MGQERDVAVVVELAEGDAEPPTVADLDDGVGLERAELTNPDPGVGQQFQHQPSQRVGFGRDGPSEPGGGGVIEKLGQWFVGSGQISGEDRSAGRRVRPVPLDDSIEERPQRAEPLTPIVRAHRCALGRDAIDQRSLESLDLRPADHGECDGEGLLVDQVAAEDPQGGVGHHDTARPERMADLVQVTGRGGSQLRGVSGDGPPFDLGLGWGQASVDQSGGVHRVTSGIRREASMTSAAL